MQRLIEALPDSVDDWDNAKKTALDGLRDGRKHPIDWKNGREPVIQATVRTMPTPCRHPRPRQMILKCQRRRENASARRSKDASMTNAGQFPRDLLAVWPDGTRVLVALPVRGVEQGPDESVPAKSSRRFGGLKLG